MIHVVLQFLKISTPRYIMFNMLPAYQITVPEFLEKWQG